MDNPETLATLDTQETQETKRRQTKHKKELLVRIIKIEFKKWLSTISTTTPHLRLLYTK